MPFDGLAGVPLETAEKKSHRHLSMCKGHLADEVSVLLIDPARRRVKKNVRCGMEKGG
jgi:hypothetical protein